MITFTFVLGILVAQGSGGLNLIAYRDALTVSTQSATSQVVPFAELWERGEKIRGQRIEVSGRVVRSFDAEASGELPAREEIWLSQGENLICAVVLRDDPRPRIGEDVAIVGISFGIVKYQSRDGVRLAPLVIGSGPPRKILNVTGSSVTWSSSSWIATAFVAAFLLIAFARFWSKRPYGKPPTTNESVEFLS